MKVIAPAIKIEFKSIEDVLADARKDAEKQYKDPSHQMCYVFGVLQAKYNELSKRVERMHNNMIEEMDIESHTGLLCDIAQNAVRMNGKVDGLLKSE